MLFVSLHDIFVKHISKKITIWFGNNVTSRKEAHAGPQVKHIKSYKLRDVIGITHKENVVEVIAGRTDAKKGEKEWLKHYPAALSQVIGGLTREEKETASELMEKWNAEGPSDDKKRK